MWTDNRLTLAEVRHPHMVRRRSELEQRDDYRAVAAELDSVLESIRSLPPDVRFRFVHDVLVDAVPTLYDIRGAAIHEMVWDHSYEEVGALVTLSRQRLHAIHVKWLDETGTEPWPATGRWSRMRQRRMVEQQS